MHYSSDPVNDIKRRAGIGQYQARTIAPSPRVDEGRTGMAQKIEKAMNVTRNIKVNSISMSDQDWSNLGSNVNLNTAISSLINSAKNYEEAQSMITTYVGRKYPKIANNQQVMQVLNIMADVAFNG